MKKTLLLFIIIIASTFSAMGQERTTCFTVYKEFKPAIIQLTDGRVIKQQLTNIFLKNSSLMYLQGTTAMEANMSNIVSVKFDDRLYVKIDTILAYPVDSVGNDVLYCATVIDIDAYQSQLRNNQVITNFSFDFSGEQISTTSMDISGVDDYKFPLVDLYFFKFNGKYVKAHERNLQLLLDKQQKRILKTFVHLDDFSWTKPDSLLKLLKALQMK